MALGYLELSDIVTKLIPCLFTITLLGGAILLQLEHDEINEQLNLRVLRDNRHMEGFAHSMHLIFGFVSDLQQNLVVGKGKSNIGFFLVTLEIEVNEDEFTLVHELDFCIYSLSRVPIECWR